MANDIINIGNAETTGNWRAAETIQFGNAVERRGAKTLGVYMGTLISDGETAWAAEANVTATADATTKKVGSKAAKLVIDAAFTTGLAATIDFTALDLSGYKKVGFWIQSSIAQAAGDLQFVMDETAACASPDETINIPALAAGVWRYVELPFAAATTTRDAVISVGIKVATDNGACNVYVDDVRAGNDYVGVADDNLAKIETLVNEPLGVIDNSKVNVIILGTVTAGQYMKPCGNGQFTVEGEDAANTAGLKTNVSKGQAIEDQGTSGAQVPMRMV